MKIHFITLPVVFALSFSCVFLPEPFNHYIDLFLIFAASVIMIYGPTRRIKVPGKNPFSQGIAAIAYGSDIKLNTKEKIAVLYSVAIVLSVFLSLLLFGDIL